MNSVQELKRLYLNENRRKYPDLPEGARSFPKWSDRTTNGLTKMIIDFLRLKGQQAERISVTGRYLDKTEIVTNVLGQSYRIGSRKWISSSMQRGSADISATIWGRSVKIEVKTGRASQSPAQKVYQEQIERTGGTYLIVRTFDDFFTWYHIVQANQETKHFVYG